MATLPAIKAAERELAGRQRLKMPLSYRLGEFAKASAAALRSTLKPSRNKAGLRLVVSNTGLRR